MSTKEKNIALTVMRTFESTHEEVTRQYISYSLGHKFLNFVSMLSLFTTNKWMLLQVEVSFLEIF